MKITFRGLSLVIRYSDMDSRLDEEGVLKKEEKDKTCKVRAWGAMRIIELRLKEKKIFCSVFFTTQKSLKVTSNRDKSNFFGTLF